MESQEAPPSVLPKIFPVIPNSTRPSDNNLTSSLRDAIIVVMEKQPTRVVHVKEISEAILTGPLFKLLSSGLETSLEEIMRTDYNVRRENSTFTCHVGNLYGLRKNKILNPLMLPYPNLPQYYQPKHQVQVGTGSSSVHLNLGKDTTGSKILMDPRKIEPVAFAPVQVQHQNGEYSQMDKNQKIDVKPMVMGTIIPSIAPNKTVHAAPNGFEMRFDNRPLPKLDTSSYQPMPFRKDASPLTPGGKVGVKLPIAPTRIAPFEPAKMEEILKRKRLEDDKPPQFQKIAKMDVSEVPMTIDDIFNRELENHLQEEREQKLPLKRNMTKTVINQNITPQELARLLKAELKPVSHPTFVTLPEQEDQRGFMDPRLFDGVSYSPDEVKILTGTKISIKPARKATEFFVQKFPDKIYCLPYKYDLLVQVPAFTMGFYTIHLGFLDGETGELIEKKQKGRPALDVENTRLYNNQVSTDVEYRCCFTLCSFHYFKKPFMLQVTLFPHEDGLKQDKTLKRLIVFKSRPFHTFARKDDDTL